MNPYWLLIPVFFFNLVGSWLTYTNSLRKADFYAPAMVALGGLACALFTYGATQCKRTEQVFVFSLFFDATIFACYYLIPLLFLKVSLSTETIVGSFLVVIGLIIVKTSGE